MTSPVAVVTGASSGIGRALARKLDEEQYRLVVCDVNEAGLRETQGLLKNGSQRVVLDVSRRPDVEKMAVDVLAQHGRIDLVINNAGVSVDASIAEVAYEDFEWLFGINFWGVVYGTKAFLPAMLKRRSGVIANVSSIFGIVGWPLQSAYNASKFAVRGFTEVLWRELKGTGVRAVTIHPGGIKTNIVRSMRFRRGSTDGANHDSTARLFDKMARTTPAQCAEIIVGGLERGDKRILVGADAVMLDRLQRTSPTGYPSVIEYFEKRVEARHAKKKKSAP